MARQEADFAIDRGAILDPYNESPWRYLIGILREQQRHHQQQQQDNSNIADVIVEYEVRAKALRNILTEAHRDPDTCVNMTSARIDLLEMIGTKDSLKNAIVLAEGLGKEYDTVRKKYWSLVLKRLRKRIESST